MPESIAFQINQRFSVFLLSPSPKIFLEMCCLNNFHQHLTGCISLNIYVCKWSISALSCLGTWMLCWHT